MSDTVAVSPPEPVFVTVIDYDITLGSGKEIEFSLRPDLGDTVHVEDESGDFELYMARTGHRVAIARRYVAIVSRRERQHRLPEPKKEGSGHGNA